MSGSGPSVTSAVEALEAQAAGGKSSPEVDPQRRLSEPGFPGGRGAGFPGRCALWTL